MARDGRSMRAGECLFLGKSGRAADITAKNDFDSNSLLVTDHAMEAWYHASIA
jgi:hypothetical protein